MKDRNQITFALDRAQYAAFDLVRSELGHLTPKVVFLQAVYDLIDKRKLRPRLRQTAPVSEPAPTPLDNLNQSLQTMKLAELQKRAKEVCTCDPEECDKGYFMQETDDEFRNRMIGIILIAGVDLE